MFRFILLVLVSAYVRGDSEVAQSTNNTKQLGQEDTLRKETVQNNTKKMLDELTPLAYGVSSGNITTIGDNVIHISKFYFDGSAPNVSFLVGKGDIISEENGSFVSFTDHPLSKYSGRDIELTLPKNLTIKDIDWLSVWSISNRENLGYIFFNRKMSPYPPQTWGLNKIVSSSAVVFVNTKTIFIPDFRYNGDYEDVHFWVGNGTPGSDGVAVPDENGSLKNLHKYTGQNIYIHFPDDISTDNIDYFGVWSKSEGLNLGHVDIKVIKGDIPKAGKIKGRTMTSSQDFRVLRVPKCCPLYFILTPPGCEERPSLEFKPNFDVYEHNETHFDNVSLDLSTIKFEPYTFVPECPSGKYPLSKESNEKFGLLQNGSLLVKGAAVSGILSQSHFCVENIEEDPDMKIFVCAPEQKIQYAVFYTYITFTIVSTFCFVAAFFFYMFWMTVEDIHRKCFTAYVFCMAITYLSLIIVQLSYVEGSGCKFLGFVFQISMIASFTLLGILCFDILFIVHYFSDNTKSGERIKWYGLVACGVPILSLIISLARNVTPDVPNSFFKPQYNKNSCSFEEGNQRYVYFYFPVILSIVVSAVCLGITKYKIVLNDKNRANDFFWIDKGSFYKFMWRKYFIISVVALMWCIETAIQSSFANSNMLIAVDMVEASQGIIIFLLFVVNKQTRKEILKSIKKRKRKPEYKLNCEEDCLHNESLS